MIKQALKVTLLRKSAQATPNYELDPRWLDVSKLPYIQKGRTSPAKYDATIYGDKRDAEYAKADVYNAEKNIPYSSRNKFKPVQVGIDDWGYYPALGAIKIPKYYTKRMWDSQLNGTNIDDEWTINDYIGHEFAHAGTMSNNLDAYRLNERIREELPKDQRPSFLNRLGGKLYGFDSDPAIYPEHSTPEFIPPLDALQKHLYKTTGSRLESPEAYDKYMESTGLNELQGADFEARMNELGLPTEVKRLFRYYRTLREKGTPERLQNYHNINRKFVPGIVQTLGRQLGQNQART